MWTCPEDPDPEAEDWRGGRAEDVLRPLGLEAEGPAAIDEEEEEEALPVGVTLPEADAEDAAIASPRATASFPLAAGAG